ncbi:hypothetical protein [Hymenobacter metallilatus]|nr:hypothetical protein [Hymenobacter metallilatus]
MVPSEDSIVARLSGLVRVLLLVTAALVLVVSIVLTRKLFLTALHYC